MQAVGSWVMRDGRGANLAPILTKAILFPLQALTAAPSVLFFAALTAMLLRHPDVQFYEIDRVALVVLATGVIARAVACRQQLVFIDRVTWPMLAISLMTLLSALGQPFDHETWSLLASKFLVPFAMFHLAQLVFTGERQFGQFEIFALIVLGYLSFTSIAFLCGARSLIFPRFILDESLGHHADRARGPLLQAVANGVSLNILGLLALHSYRRRATHGFKTIVLLASVPVAILATMTRAVWLSFAGSIAVLIFTSRNRSMQRACAALVLVAGIGIGVVLSCNDAGSALNDRFSERGPLDYREAVYAGSWEMFLKHPVMGWGFHRMPAMLPRFVGGYQEKLLYPHNTYLELLVEHGVTGLALYLWLLWELWRLGRGPIPAAEKYGFLDRNFHRLWPILLGVYCVNAALVVMSYQFVNGLLFAMAGMLAAQQRRSKALQPK